MLGNGRSVARALAEGVDPNCQDAGGRGALHFAAQEGNLECLQALLQAGAEADLVDDDGRSALHLAAYAGHLEALRALLQAGADVALADEATSPMARLPRLSCLLPRTLQAIITPLQARIHPCKPVHDTSVSHFSSSSSAAPFGPHRPPSVPWAVGGAAGENKKPCATVAKAHTPGLQWSLPRPAFELISTAVFIESSFQPCFCPVFRRVLAFFMKQFHPDARVWAAGIWSEKRRKVTAQISGGFFTPGFWALSHFLYRNLIGSRWHRHEPVFSFQWFSIFPGLRIFRSCLGICQLCPVCGGRSRTHLFCGLLCGRFGVAGDSHRVVDPIFGGF